MKIAIIHRVLGYKGGLETRLLNYIDFFIKKKHEVTLIVNKIDKSVKLPVEVRLIKARQKFIPKPYRLLTFDWALNFMVNRKKYDLVFSLGRTSYQDVVLAPANHLGYMKAMSKTKKKIKDKIEIKLDFDAFNKSKIVLAASEMMKNELVQLFGVSAEKISILHPPLNIQKFNQEKVSQKRELRENFRMNPKKQTFVFVSTGHDRKGLDLLLNVFKKLENEPFELFIAGSKGFVETENVKFAGFVKDIDEFYIAADFTIHPAKYEPFGQIISESVQCGTPVLLSRMTGAHEIITEKEGIVLDNFEEKNWIEAIKSVKERKFEIDKNWAKKNELTVEQHCEKILQIWADFNVKK